MMILVFQGSHGRIATPHWTVEEIANRDCIEVSYQIPSSKVSEAIYSSVEIDITMDDFIVALASHRHTGICNLSHKSRVR